MLGLGALSASGCGKENTVNAGSPMCQAGELRCKSTAVEVCKADGSGFEVQEVCSESTPFCAAGACVACETGSQYCSGNVVYGRCHDSNEELAVQDCGDLSQVCSEGRCRVASCEPTSTSCEGNEVVTCAADGLSIAKREPCGASQQCVDGKCERQRCQPGAHCKNTRQVELCSADGLTILELRDCGAAEGCEAGECLPKFCTESTTFCKDYKRMRCSASGAAEEEWPCAPDQSCETSVEGGIQCSSWVCEPGADYCADTEPRRCAADGLSSVSLGEPCTGRTTCSAGACGVWQCEPGLDFCAAGEARACAADGLSSAPLTPCDGSDPSCELKTCDDLPADYAGYARWPLPGTAGHPFDYLVDPGARTVRDQVTGLLWQRQGSPLLHSWESAKSYCEDLVWAERDDWRLPTRLELLSLVDYTRVGPAIDTGAFPDTPAEAFWSGSERGASGQAWTVGFNQGDAVGTAPSASRRVRCVTVGAPQKPIPVSGHFFQVTGNTVLDTATGLEWQRGTSPTDRSQGVSASYCLDLELDGKTDWRLPTAAELSSLVREVGVTTTFIDESIFPGTQSDNYWSATIAVPVTSNPTYWRVAFNTGQTSTGIWGNNEWARCVR
ncbi:MAG: DUF1566 domain-containing protein [Polyangiaceae bacterium]|nr:DUF1566 domain-containing protein [Polyangiaceae bacterium]MCW5792065.1 DUF1566 domain-containing protein [Polyangiaceae bacterium]